MRKLHGFNMTAVVLKLSDIKIWVKEGEESSAFFFNYYLEKLFGACFFVQKREVGIWIAFVWMRMIPLLFPHPFSNSPICKV